MEMGRYCKAYPARRFREYPGWSEDVGSLRPERRIENGTEVEMERKTIGDDDVLYLQESFVVTDGIFKDEHVVFADVSDDWKRFCIEKLGFDPTGGEK